VGRSFLILHGWKGSGVEHWQTWLARRLEDRGERVLYPSLPEPDTPRLDRWLAELDRWLGEAGGDATVICHSLGCILWLHHAARRPEPVSRVLLVAPPAPFDEPALRDFFPVQFEPRLVEAAAGETLLVCAVDDPYAPGGADRVFPGLRTERVRRGAHLNIDAGFGPWPWVEEWALRR
jgi:predicted alpha/beta hydrolase family esterase